MQAIIGIIAQPLAWLLSYIYSLISNYGITLIVFTVFVKFCLYPLYAAQVKSTVRMADIQPKVAALQKKHADDKETMNIKMMELYKEEKFNPMGGCLPMIIQMPIIFGLFALLRDPMQYLSSDSMLLAIHESFFWIKDLSQPDAWILPIASGITTFISFNQTQSQQGSNAMNPQMAPMMNMMKYFFPIMIVWMGRSFPAGLAMYWFIGTVVQIGFNFRLNFLRKKLKGKNQKK
ncbi:YidC/Oxa1 family membrane protein insertase [Clostridium aminobutyricum]|uniref:Membrane protein insertase YidC n=1 Tax=Clostridium aminobutyricum TaxID=33953 RepID=A0A939D924_CLOAM|nr:YidC/Oxa1 family membrane protein insertase [Clostridium aminobutyricum]MBN7773330.1 membrane protein insertase YidC [Clostridium aminobutyricum]